MKKLVRLCERSTKASLGHNKSSARKHSKFFGYRKYLQARHMYPLLYRLEDIKYRLGVLKEFRSRAAIEFNSLHAQLSLCITYLSGRTRSHHLTNFVGEIGAIHEDVGKAKLTDSPREQYARRNDEVNVIYCGFSVHTSRVYLGESKSTFRVSDHRRISCRSDAASHPDVQRCQSFMARTGHWMFAHKMWYFKSKFDRKVHERFFIKKYNFALNVVSRSRSPCASMTNLRTTSRPSQSVRRRTNFSSLRMLSVPSAIANVKLPAILLFGGAGGATSGILASGKFDVKLVVEYDLQVVKLHKKLYPHVCEGCALQAG